MKIVKPKRLPPPPPPPPRDPYYSNNVFPRQAASEYEAESVISGTPSTRSLQPINYAMTFGPSSSCASSLSQFASCCSCSNEPQPVPKQRVSRPRLSISPEPKLSNEDPVTRKKNRPYDRYRSLQYRRYLERQIERTFKYLRDRAERLRKRELEMTLQNIPEDAQRSFARHLLAKEETTYLRSLRTKITRKDFEEIREIGCGAMGRVSLVRRVTINQEDELYAMKTIKKSQVLELNQWAHVMAERDILAEADNDWIVQMHFSFQDNFFLYFILEFVPGGDLIDLLKKVNVFSEEWAQFYIAEISLAVQAVHDMGFIHRDIKPDNILIDARGHVKLTDFGFCTGFRWSHDSSYYQDDSNNSHFGNSDGFIGGSENFVDDHPTITKALTKRQEVHALKKRTLSCVGSPHYIAPEVLCPDYRKYENFREHLCDWWSVGVILYQMIEGHPPFIDLDKLRNNEFDPRFEDKREVQYRIVNWQRYLEFNPLGQTAISKEARDLIMKFLCHPQSRVCQTGIAEIQNHLFFRSFDSSMWLNIRSTMAPYKPELRSEHDTSNFGYCLQANDNTLIRNTPGAKLPLHDFTFKSFPNDRICRN